MMQKVIIKVLVNVVLLIPLFIVAWYYGDKTNELSISIIDRFFE